MARPRLTSTPVGASALAGALVTIAMYCLSLWRGWSQVPGDVKGAVQTVLTALAVYGAGYLSVVRAPGQSVQMELTPSALPTVQLAEGVPAQEGARA